MVEKESWDTHWETFYKQSSGNQYPEVSIIRFVAKNFYKEKDRSKINILDLGCGTGCHSWFLAREGFATFGIDGAPSAIEVARNKLLKDGLSADLRVGDFVMLPFENHSMDAVIDAAAIQHNNMEAIADIIKEIKRVLKPGGKFFGTLIADSKDLSDESFYTHFFTSDEIKFLFQLFENVEIDETGYTVENGSRSIRFWLVEAESK